MTEDEKVQVAINKIFASKTVDSLVSERESIRSTISSLGNWLIAASLTINSAGAFASASSTKQFGALHSSTLCFSIGIVFSFLCAAAMHQNYMSLMANIHRQIILMASVAADGIPTPNLQSNLQAESYALRKVGFIYIGLWLVSVFLFVAGVISLGQSDVRVDKGVDQRCAWLEHDMLSSSPQRSDSTSLFQAFGCHPRGAELPSRTP